METNPLSSAEMTITLHLSPEEERWLRERASESGQDVTSYVQRLVQRDIKQPSTLSELLGPIHADLRQSDMTEQELDTLLEDELAEVRKGRKAARDRAR